MKSTILALVALVCLSVAALAADVTGKWAAETTGPQGNAQKIMMDLKQDGSKVTGTVSGRGGDNPISDGKVDGDTVTFVQKMERNGQTMEIAFTGKISGDSIAFTRGMGDRKTEFVAKKQ